MNHNPLTKEKMYNQGGNLMAHSKDVLSAFKGLKEEQQNIIESYLRGEIDDNTAFVLIKKVSDKWFSFAKEEARNE